ncbi:MAG: hypothetical protein J2P17_08380 [Mycobacterium sp.]|nr:hypothetical protein [Mycobacterium sp.]
MKPLSPGHFQVRYSNPTSDGAAALRLTVRDSPGNTLTQIVHEAYRITPGG